MGAGFNVSLGAAQSPTMPEQLIPLFQNFQPGCAPTVFPMFNYANGASLSSVYNIVNQQHQGQSAYLSNITKEGTLVARLYAFDGCSVSYADVNVMTKCPTLQFQQSQPALGLKSNYYLYWDSTNGNALTITVPTT
jgi:hypothetical protein